ncbi:MAG: catalase/peroxidase HPI [Anaerolineae bacterium]|nr:catalase/peroxidase HPI [Gloeobacterales cyanobacterium ES-bin-313]
MRGFKHTLSLTVAIVAISAGSAVSAWAEENPRPNQFWWPDQLDLSPLRRNAVESNPLGKDFNYAKEFQTLDLEAVKKDIRKVLTTSQDWWPADYGTYGPFFVRMAWHGAGTYRISDGRGGAGGAQQRFEPLNSWPDNANLDKARRLVWPVKKKYGQKLSWGDLMVLTGNEAMESMGFKTFGFGGGRNDDWEPDLIYWGAGAKFLSDNRDKNGKLEKTLAATQMGLIYVNPEGPNGNPDPIASAKDIREAFGRMAMNDEETVALIAGGHTFGKAHGATSAKCLGVAPAAEVVEKQGLGWINKCGKGKGADTTTSGLEGAWSADPISFTTQYFDNLFAFDWVKTKSPAGATQWMPKTAVAIVPDAHNPKKLHPPMMFTTDLALKFDPEYRKISTRFRDNPEEFKRAFAKAWFKLTHRDMGPRSRYLGADIPKEALIWQDPVPAVDYKLVDASDLVGLKAKILASGLSESELVQTAWASAASFRGTDKRGGANGARIGLAPEKDWAVNDPAELAKVLKALEGVRSEFNTGRSDGKKVSLADLIVLGGTAAVEAAAKRGGYVVQVPFSPGRTDTSQEQTDVKSFAVLEPTADGFRNYFSASNERSPAELLVERASLLTLTVPEMTVLVGGMRALDANVGDSRLGVFTDRPGTLSNDFFVNLLDMSTEWTKSASAKGIYEGRDRKTSRVKWTATPVDLVFGSDSELRAVAEVYASDDAKEKFVQDFVNAWVKVMNLDRFGLERS